MNNWATPRDIADRIRRRWNDGSLLATSLRGETLFPMRIPLRHPDAQALLHRFSEALEWQKQVEAGSRQALGFGYEIEWEEIRHRHLGRNRIATAVTIPTDEDALRLIGLHESARQFGQLASLSIERLPGLRDWILWKPHRLLEHAVDWESILRVVEWLRKNPDSGLYMRQVDIPGVNTKFIESRSSLIREILDALASVESPESGKIAVTDFHARFGLRSKPVLLRFKILDPELAIHGLADLSAPVGQIAGLNLPIKHVFITENEINGLAFPPLPRSIVFFGLGYGLESLAGIPWLSGKAIHYWGDIDTHGFAMLDRIRGFLPEARSLLMDHETLMAHRSQWVEEPVPARKPLDRLIVPERNLFEDLLSNRYGNRVRLEQERIGFNWVIGELSKIVIQ